MDNCRGYYFGRQMKTICRTSGNVECTLGDGTKCVDYTGPILKTLKKDGCDDITCIDQTPESCRQDIIYDFTLQNRNDQKVKFDLTSPQIANSKVAWKIVGNNKANFADCVPGETSKYINVIHYEYWRRFLWLSSISIFIVEIFTSFACFTNGFNKQFDDSSFWFILF